MNIYFLYLTCSLRFLSRRKKNIKMRKKITKKENEEVIYSWKYLYMNDIQYLETEDKNKKKLSLTIELPKGKTAWVLFVPHSQHTWQKADEEN